MIIGPHATKNDLWKYDICELFLFSPQSYITYENNQGITRNFPPKPVDYIGKGRIYVIHTGYVNNIESENTEVVEKSFVDLQYIIKIAEGIFNGVDKIFINMHLVSSKAFDKKRLDGIISLMPKNMKLVIEHVANDNFDNFIKVFEPMCNERFGLTYDTAHVFSSGCKIERLIEERRFPLPDLIHLNGCQTQFGSKRDIHTAMCSEYDKIWTLELLKKFIKKYKKIPMIIETRESYSFMDELDTMLKAVGK